VWQCDLPGDRAMEIEGEEGRRGREKCYVAYV